MEEHINMASYIAFEDLIFEMHLDGIKNQKRVKKCCCYKDIIIHHHQTISGRHNVEMYKEKRTSNFL